MASAFRTWILCKVALHICDYSRSHSAYSNSADGPRRRSDSWKGGHQERQPRSSGGLHVRVTQSVTTYSR